MELLFVSRKLRQDAGATLPFNRNGILKNVLFGEARNWNRDRIRNNAEKELDRNL
jgi:hypothetical protein